ncbi:MAG: ubiquitin-like protein Pup [Kineosporiaceae bacterium]
MAGQDQQRQTTRREGTGEAEGELPTAPATEATGEEVDDLLDEIDSVLEENSEEFVRGFVQKGGQ